MIPMTNATTWTGIILAGGLSSRMGTNKTLLVLNDATVLERTVAALAPEVSQILISAGEHARDYERFGYPCVLDRYPGKGPLAGLHAAMQASKTDWNVVCACDMPRIQTSFFAGLKRIAAESDMQSPIIVPRVNGRIHPLAGVYHRSVLPGLEQRLQEDRLRVTRWLDEIGCRYADAQELERAGVPDAEWQLANMNTPEDYQRLQAERS